METSSIVSQVSEASTCGPDPETPRPSRAYVWKPPGPVDLAQAREEGPNQPVLKQYPKSKIGSKLRTLVCTVFFH